MKAPKTTLKIITCDLSMPTLDVDGKLIGRHGLPVHLLTPTGKLNDGQGIAWVFAGLDQAVNIADAVNTIDAVTAERDALLKDQKAYNGLRTKNIVLIEAIKGLLEGQKEVTASNPLWPKCGIRFDKARAAIALCEKGEK